MNHIHAGNSRLLTTEERRTLNNLVQKLEVEYGEPGKKTWKSIHNILGVDNIGIIHWAQYKPTETILLLLIENAQIRSGVSETMLRAQLNQATAQVSDLTERNADLVEKATRIQHGFVSLDNRCKAQAAELLSANADLKRVRDQFSYAQIAKKEAQATIAAFGKRFLLMYIVLGITSLCAAFFGYRVFARHDVCEFGGNPYTLGSIIDNPQAADVECVATAPDMTPRWQKIGQK